MEKILCRKKIQGQIPIYFLIQIKGGGNSKIWGSKYKFPNIYNNSYHTHRWVTVENDGKPIASKRPPMCVRVSKRKLGELL